MTDFTEKAMHYIDAARDWALVQGDHQLADMEFRTAAIYAELAKAEQLKAVNDNLDLLRQAVEQGNEQAEQIRAILEEHTGYFSEPIDGHTGCFSEPIDSHPADHPAARPEEW